MREKSSTEPVESSAVCYATLEQWARGQIQAQLQQIQEEEVTTFLGSARHTRGAGVCCGSAPGQPERYGTPRQFAMMKGIVRVRHLRARDLTDC